jgi:hypothetical protein
VLELNIHPWSLNSKNKITKVKIAEKNKIIAKEF